MKILSSFKKELIIALRGFYFYIELFMALLIVGVFLFLVPDNFNKKSAEYIYMDLPVEMQELYLEEIEKNTIEGEAKEVPLMLAKEEKLVSVYMTEDKEIYVVNNRSDLEYLADHERELATVITMDEAGEFMYEYYLQGYESAKFKNLLKILHVESNEKIAATFDSQKVRPLSDTYTILSDRENMLPSVLVFNGALLGLFIVAAYIFLDKQEGVIKAFALTPTPVWQYLISKIGVIMVSSILSTFVILLPLMGLSINYVLLLVLLLSTAFFSSALGLLIASFYENLMQAFGMIYAFLMLMLLPNIAYFIPSWNPSWIKFIPSYPMLEGFKSILLGNKDWGYIFSVSSGFLVIGLVIFMYSNERYKKHLLD